MLVGAHGFAPPIRIIEMETKMTTQNQFYGNLLRVNTDHNSAPEVLRRVPLGSNVSSGGVDEGTLQAFFFRFPSVLPTGAIDPSCDRMVPICRELNLSSGAADALYANNIGRLALVEFKIWRNPQARREVIGQILDYAKDLAGLSYEDLQNQVAHKTGRNGNVLFDLVREEFPDLDEAEFVDNVTRSLRYGEFMMLIIGDGIQESAASIVDFLKRDSGLHFNLAMVEAALYRDAHHNLIIQPRILARTEIVQRFVITGGQVEDVVVAPATDREIERREPDPYDDFYRPLLERLAAEDIRRIPRGRRGGWWGRLRGFYTGHDHITYGVIIEENPSISVFVQISTDNRQVVFDELHRQRDVIGREMAGFEVEWWPYDDVSNMGVVINLERPLTAIDTTEQVDAVRNEVFRCLLGLRNAVQPRLDAIIRELE